MMKRRRTWLRRGLPIEARKANPDRPYLTSWQMMKRRRTWLRRRLQREARKATPARKMIPSTVSLESKKMNSVATSQVLLLFIICQLLELFPDGNSRHLRACRAVFQAHVLLDHRDDLELQVSTVVQDTARAHLRLKVLLRNGRDWGGLVDDLGRFIGRAVGGIAWDSLLSQMWWNGSSRCRHICLLTSFGRGWVALVDDLLFIICELGELFPNGNNGMALMRSGVC
ncbi:hypothetical protein IQ07DRAFT_367826 [Pyrenochaeta sp. DS3sAY3a]|nr:hypothetical protein IQ07DRAFT_367826 [Pyrenochaeta sp. DS3sAY3a]